MTPERWQKLASLYDIASKESYDQRRAVLGQISDDPSLVDEVLRMLEMEQQPASFLEASPAKQWLEEPDTLLPIGDMIDGRYRVVRRLGAGGMGEVYEALDEELGTPLALKTLRPERLGDQQAQRRLKREAALALRITHPNVCRLYGTLRVPVQGLSILVLTMELLSGPSLAQRLQEQGPLSEADALPIVRQILLALEAAHGAGVVHRDLKPANVLLHNDRAVVTDFGLAGPGPGFDGPTGATTVTQPGQWMGTLEYMAPEQLRQKEAVPASDLYSLGVIMYELVTGNRPTTGANGLQEMMNRLLTPPSGPREAGARVSRRYNAIVCRCLAREPEQRFASAREVLNVLDGAWLRPRIARGPLALSSRRGALLALAGTASAAALATGGYYWRQSTAALPASPLLLVTPVSGATGELATLWLALRKQLDQSAHVKVWDPAGLTDALTSLRLPAQPPSTISSDLWRRIAQRLNADFAIFFSLTSLAGEYLLQGRMEWLGKDLNSPRRQWTQSFPAPSQDRLPDAVREAARWIRNAAGETSASIAATDRPPGMVTTSSFEALQLFEKAEAILNDHPEEAISYLSEAVRLDPKFALAWFRLGDRQVFLADWPNGLQSWNRAAALASEGHLSLREADRIRTLYALEIGDLRSAESGALRWAEDFPEELRPLWEAFHARLLLGRISDAENIIPRMAAQPKSERYWGLARAQVALWKGNSKEVREMGQMLEKLGGNAQAQGLGYTSLSHALEGDFIAAIRAAERYFELPSNSRRSAGYQRVAALEAATGNFSAAEQRLQAGIQWDEKNGLRSASAYKHYSLAYLAWLQGKFAAVPAHCTLAARSGDPLTMVPACVALLARSGHRTDSRQLAQQWKAPVDLPRFRYFQFWMQGEQELASGNHPAALESLRTAERFDASLLPSEPLLNGLVQSGNPAAKELAQHKLHHTSTVFESTETAPVGTIYYFRHHAGEI